MSVDMNASDPARYLACTLSDGSRQERWVWLDCVVASTGLIITAYAKFLCANASELDLWFVYQARTGTGSNAFHLPIPDHADSFVLSEMALRSCVAISEVTNEEEAVTLQLQRSPDRHDKGVTIPTHTGGGKVTLLEHADACTSCELIYSVNPCVGDMWRTQLISIQPRLIVENSSSRPLEILMQSTEEDLEEHIVLQPMSRRAVYVAHSEQLTGVESEWLVRPQIEGPNDITWSQCFCPTKLGDFALKCRRGHNSMVVQTSVSHSDGSNSYGYQLHFSVERSPYRLVNESSITLVYYQSGSVMRDTLEPQQEVEYAWDILDASPMMVLGVHADHECIDSLVHVDLDAVPSFAKLPIVAEGALLILKVCLTSA